MEGVKVFQTDIIDNPKYQTYKRGRGVLVILLVILGAPAYFILQDTSILEAMEEIPELRYYFGVLAILGILYGIVHLISWNTKPIGKITIKTHQICLKINGTEIITNFSDVEKIILVRNSTFHKEEHFGKPYTGNNWMELFCKNGQSEKIEFLILNKEHSQSFDKMVVSLISKLEGKVDYKSI